MPGRIANWMRPIFDVLDRGERRVWRGDGRLYVEVASLRPEDSAAFARAVRAGFEDMRRVRWARFNAQLGRVVVAHQAEGEQVEAIVRRVVQIERQVTHGRRGLKRDRPASPGDSGPVLRTAIELGADALGLAAGLALRVSGAKTVPIEIHAAVLLSLLEFVPVFKQGLEHRLGRASAEVLLSLARSLDQGLLQAVGTVADLSMDYLRLRELQAQRSAWAQREPELGAESEDHPEEPRSVPQRPGTASPGPVERYEQKAVPASLASFALGLFAVRSVERASAALFGGVPRPTRLGREAFSAHVGWRLGAQGILVVDPEALRRFDRVDSVVCQLPEGAPEEEAIFRSLFEEVRRAGLRLFVVSAAPETGLRFGVETVKPGAATVALIRRLQTGNGVVAFLGSDPVEAVLAADLSLYFPAGAVEDPAARWSADIICLADRNELRSIVACLAAARRASGQSVTTSVAEVVASLALLVGGLHPRTTRQVMLVTTVASMVALGNGVRLAQAATRAPPPPAPAPPPWHALGVEDVIQHLGASREGLSEEDAKKRRPVPQPKPNVLAHFSKLMVEEMKTPLTPVLAAGAGISALSGTFADAGLISLVLGVTAGIGSLQRLSVERALLDLQQGKVPMARVRRGDRYVRIPGSALVPGDIMKLGAGELVPADARIVTAVAAEVDEAALTGESLPVRKFGAPVESAMLAERSSMVYAGTTVAAGTIEAVVVATGDDTEARRALLRAGRDRPVSGVQARLQEITKLTVPVAGLSGLGLALLGVLRHDHPRDVLRAGVSLAVSAVPEGLPILAALAERAAAERLSRRGALTRNAHALEALGRVNVFCIDKTGTLTEGRVRLESVSDGERSLPLRGLDEARRSVLAAALRASPAGERLPHLTDQALVEGAAEIGVTACFAAPGWQRLRELPFEARRGYHATLGQWGDEPARLSVKGAPEKVLDRCTERRLASGEQVPLSKSERRRLAKVAAEMAGRGFRMLAVAEAAWPSDPAGLTGKRVRDLAFVGFLGLTDPIRSSARRALFDLQRAGINIMMLTGDHPATAENIARSLGIKNGKNLLTGPELDQLDDRELARRIGEVSVLARVTPEHKLRIVQSLQRAGRVVAMTGDGANDVPAIILADVGIAIAGAHTEAAYHAADLVVTNDRLEVAVDAVLEGRALWVSLREALALLVGGNLGEIAFTTLGSVVDRRSALNPRQLLLINLLTDAIPAMVIAVRPPPHLSPDDLLREGPEVSLGASLTRQILWRGGLTASAALGAWVAARGQGDAPTVALLAVTAAQLGQTLVAAQGSKAGVVASLGSLAALLGAVETPPIARFFASSPVGARGLATAGAAAGAATLVAWAGPRLLRSVG